MVTSAPMDRESNSSHDKHARKQVLGNVRTRSSRPSSSERDNDVFEAQTSRLVGGPSISAYAGSHSARLPVSHQLGRGRALYEGSVSLNHSILQTGDLSTVYGQVVPTDTNYSQMDPYYHGQTGEFGIPFPHQFDNFSSFDYDLGSTPTPPSLYTLQQGAPSSSSSHAGSSDYPLHESHKQDSSSQTTPSDEHSSTLMDAEELYDSDRFSMTAEQAAEAHREYEVQTTLPITDFGFRYKSGHEVLWKKFHRIHRQMMTEIVRKETGYKVRTIREKLCHSVSPFLAMMILSGNEEQLHQAVEFVFPNFYSSHSQDRWKMHLKDEEADRLIRDMSRITNRAEDFVLYHFSHVDADETNAFRLAHGTDYDRMAYALKWKIVQYGRPGPPVK
ncbi:hypothetical protein CBS101457_000265 [Exobasidium rhododendri]|nr:hypothetical protein CBS101457_000265 [Exobasidium rhododendri]